MKTRIIIYPLLALFLLSISACSKDDIDEPIEPMKSVELFDQKKLQNIEFKEIGEFEWDREIDCIEDGRFILKGKMKDASLGFLSTKMMICTDYDQQFYLKGTQTTAKGEELHFTAYEIKKDATGYWMVFNYLGGTGSFANVSGQAKVKSSEGFQSTISGVYKFHGLGTLNL